MVGESTERGNPFVMRYWIHAAPTGAYQLVCWGRASDREEVMREAEAIFSCFEFLP